MNQSISILIADNDPMIRQCLRHIIEIDPRIQVLWEAENGLQALKIAKEMHPDLILIDAQLPRMDGLETTRCLRQWSILSKVIIISVYSQMREEALQAGADEFVTKDACCELLQKQLKEMLEPSQ